MTEVSGDETRAAIRRATFQALRRHGYANLSIAHIATELGKSKSLLYSYYESKDDVLVALLDHTIEGYGSDPSLSADTSIEDTLKQFLETLLVPPDVDEESELIAVLLELRVQAVSDIAYRERFTILDQRLRITITDMIERGIEAGEFASVDATRIAAHVVLIINGMMLQQATTAADASMPTGPRQMLYSYLDETLGTNYVVDRR
ncbi:TetR/AcrR family transcriptional regulator [Halorhabdus salina]|uniref:TetR/AcrR family transcriptional regulator n=1 Tax=Halorhabdus salina TaxID=2750670 RepID=UPI0015EE840B|nr:TetR/AcrR family transcriptional regulator [Halorhabdus salina]